MSFEVRSGEKCNQPRTRVGGKEVLEDVSGTVAIINKLSENTSLRSEIARRGKELVRVKYNWESQFNNLHNLYDLITVNAEV